MRNSATLDNGKSIRVFQNQNVMYLTYSVVSGHVGYKQKWWVKDKLCFLPEMLSGCRGILRNSALSRGDERSIMEVRLMVHRRNKMMRLPLSSTALPFPFCRPLLCILSAWNPFHLTTLTSFISMFSPAIENGRFHSTVCYIFQLLHNIHTFPSPV